LVLIVPIALAAPVDPVSLVTAFALVSAVGLLTITAWMARLR